MIVYGGGSIIRSGLLQRIEDSLQQAGVDLSLIHISLEKGGTEEGFSSNFLESPE